MSSAPPSWRRSRGIAVAVAVGLVCTPLRAELAKNSKAPAFHVRTVTGAALDSRRVIGKNTAVVMWWGRFFPPSRLQLPSLEKLHSKYSRRGLRIIGFCTDANDKAEVDKYCREVLKSRLSFPIVGKTDSLKVGKLYHANPPTLYIIDRHGTIRFVSRSWSRSVEQQVEREIQRLMSAK